MIRARTAGVSARPLLHNDAESSGEAPKSWIGWRGAGTCTRVRRAFRSTRGDREAAVMFSLFGGPVMTAGKRRWVSPEIRRYGTFESATQGKCPNKDYGAGDGFLFQGNPITCTAS